MNRMDGYGRQRRFGSPWFFAGGLAVLVIVGIVAVALSRGGDDGGGEGAGGEGASREVAASVSLDGQSLPMYVADGDDSAEGMAAPVAVGADFDDAPVGVADGDAPQLVVFLAHWCPHCQAEVPKLVGLATAGAFPPGVEVVGVATQTSATRDNYPPSEWLEREGWPFPVLVDTANGSVATAYGVSGYPFFVLLDAEGRVLARASGELDEERVRELVALAVASTGDGDADDEDGEGDDVDEPDDVPAGPQAPAPDAPASPAYP